MLHLNENELGVIMMINWVGSVGSIPPSLPEEREG